MSTIRANTLVNMDGVTAVTLTGQVAAKSWVNFNGTSTIAARASFNVSSLTDNGTGLYFVNYTNSLVDANHASLGTSQPNNYGGAYPGTGDTSSGTQTSSRTSIEVRDNSNGASDSNFVQIAVFR
jgi:hypothetical protein